MTDSWLRTLVASDIHVPYHDDRAIDLTCKAIEYWMPDQVVVNGDLLDCYSLSRFEKDPQRMLDGGLQGEIDAARRILSSFKSALGRRTRITVAAPEGRRTMQVKPGNHEDRLRRYLWKDNALYGVNALEIPELLALRQIGVEYAEDDTWLANGRLVIRHGTKVRTKAGQSAMAELEGVKYSHSGITGHTHRMASVYATTPYGVVGWWEGGCLCQLTPEYVKHPDWQQGITLVWSSIAGESFTVQSVPFLDGKCLIEGKRLSV